MWDKVISGSCKILVFVALEILLSFKMVLLGTSRPDAVVRFLCNVSKRRKRSRPSSHVLNALRPHAGSRPQMPQENTDAIVTKAIDLWHKYCGTPVHAV